MNAASRLCLALILAASGVAHAAGAADAVTAVDPYMRLMPPGATATAAFMTLRNGGDKDVKLVKAESPVAKTVELHTHINEGGVMKMRQVNAIDVKSKNQTVLEPGGLHIMMINPVGTVKEGDKVAITLGFDDGSSKKIEAVAKRPGATPAAAAPMDHSAHQMKH